MSFPRSIPAGEGFRGRISRAARLRHKQIALGREHQQRETVQYRSWLQLLRDELNKSCRGPDVAFFSSTQSHVSLGPGEWGGPARELPSLLQARGLQKW